MDWVAVPGSLGTHERAQVTGDVVKRWRLTVSRTTSSAMIVSELKEAAIAKSNYVSPSKSPGGVSGKPGNLDTSSGDHATIINM